jgi:Do/DeqQ family serine protease
MKIKNLIVTLITAVFGGVVAIFLYTKAVTGQTVEKISAEPARPVHLASWAGQDARDVTYPDFTFAAEKAIHCVVHIKVKSTQNVYSGSGNPFYDFFYGYREKQVPMENYVGSGVIISADGYIVTNNHVIARADEVEISLNDKRMLPAKIIGIDPTTDLALLKVDETGLPYLAYGDAEALRVGEWVLAVGNPYNLTSTVTAGIVSAKARHLGIITSQIGIESFIQTDAAVNPGNSGGALVNIRGELVGINTAIASRTGDYSGNSFAIPVTIVQKVIADLKEYGHVQRARLGVNIEEVTSELVKEKGLGKIEGIYVAGTMEDGAAAAAGIREGDVIKAINNVNVNSFSELQEQLSKYRPSDRVEVTIIRDKNIKQIPVTLRNIDGNTEILRGDNENLVLGAKFEEISTGDKQRLRLRAGVRVKDAGDGKLKEMGVRNGFIIVSVNDKPVNSAKDIQANINAVESKGQILIRGIYPGGQTVLYGFEK